jgi:hypothetical protein
VPTQQQTQQQTQIAKHVTAKQRNESEIITFKQIINEQIINSKSSTVPNTTANKQQQ